jgi:hypothetical protein
MIDSSSLVTTIPCSGAVVIQKGADIEAKGQDGWTALNVQPIVDMMWWRRGC